DDDEDNDGEEGNDDDDDDQEDEGSDKDDEEEGSDDRQASDDEVFIHSCLSTHAEEETRDEESFDPIPKTPENSDDEGNGEENLGINVGREEGQDEEEEEDELYKDVNINQGRVIVAMVEGVIVGADIGRRATEVGVCTSICEVVSNIDSIPASGVGLSILVTNCDDMDELYCDHQD
nr:hypothetical protein [Tanacetum cinerariifolium]